MWDSHRSLTLFNLEQQHRHHVTHFAKKLLEGITHYCWFYPLFLRIVASSPLMVFFLIHPLTMSQESRELYLIHYFNLFSFYTNLSLYLYVFSFLNTHCDLTLVINFGNVILTYFLIIFFLLSHSHSRLFWDPIGPTRIYPGKNNFH